MVPLTTEQKSLMDEFILRTTKLTDTQAESLDLYSAALGFYISKGLRVEEAFTLATITCYKD